MRRFLLLFTLLFFSMPHFAFAAEGYDEGRPVEKIMGNTGNQFVYAFFGKEIFLYYLNDEQEISIIEESTESELALLSQPFNANLGQFFMGGLSLVYLATLFYMIAKLIFFAIEMGWLLQRDGKSNWSEKQRKALSLKVLLIGSLVVIPVSISSDSHRTPFVTNLGTVILFDLLGRVHSHSDEATSELVESQRQPLETIALPSASSKMESAQNLNLFYTCLRVNEGRSDTSAHNLELRLYKDNGDSVSGVVSEGSCSLRISFGVDFESDELLDRLANSDSEIGLIPNLFADSQKVAFTSLIEDIFNRANKYSVEFSKNNSVSAWLPESSFESHTSLSLTASELKRWPERCDEIESWGTGEVDEISPADRYYFHHLSARCQSKRIADKLVYPESYEAMANFLGNSSRSQRELAMCVDDSMLSTIEDKRFMPQYSIKGESSGAIERINLKSCLANLCAKSSVQDGGMYACTRGMELYERRLNDLRVQDRGTLMLGFYMFNLFMHSPPSSHAKHVFNGFSMTFKPDAEPNQEVNGEPYLVVSIPVPEQKPVKNMRIVYDMWREYPDTELPTIYAKHDDEHFIRNIMGTDRLLSCAKNPLQSHAGYVCGNVPQEFSRFGVTMLKNVIMLKTVFTIGQSVGKLRQPIKGFLDRPSGKVVESPTSANRQQEMVSNMVMQSLKGLASISQISDATFEGLEPVFQLKVNSTDEFGYLNTERAESYLQTISPALASLAYLDPDSSFIKIIDTGLMFALVFAVLFAFVIPIFPMFIFVGALIKFSYLLFFTLLTHGIKLVDASTEKDGDFLGEKLDKVFADWLALIFKLPLTVIGLVLAWLMSNVIISHVVTNINMTFLTNDGEYGTLDMLVMFGATLVVIFIVYNMVLTVIESFYDFTVEWILGTMHGSPFSQTRAIGFKDSRQVLSLLGR
jgi:hypothetical protein